MISLWRSKADTYDYMLKVCNTSTKSTLWNYLNTFQNFNFHVCSFDTTCKSLFEFQPLKYTKFFPMLYSLLTIAPEEGQPKTIGLISMWIHHSIVHWINSFFLETLTSVAEPNACPKSIPITEAVFSDIKQFEACLSPIPMIQWAAHRVPYCETNLRLRVTKPSGLPHNLISASLSRKQRSYSTNSNMYIIVLQSYCCVDAAAMMYRVVQKFFYFQISPSNPQNCEIA